MTRLSGLPHAGIAYYLLMITSAEYAFEASNFEYIEERIAYE